MRGIIRFAFELEMPIGILFQIGDENGDQINMIIKHGGPTAGGHILLQLLRKKGD
jgi:hypothetical protein